MAKTIGNIKSVISSRLHGTTLNKIGDFYLLCKEAGETVANRIDLQEARRRALLPNAVYDQVYDYALPSDFKAPISLNKQANNIDNSDQSRTYSNQFNNQKKDNSYAVVWEDMTQFLRFARYLNAPLVIDKADSLTENGTWIVSGNGSSLELDTNNYMSGIGSLKCDVASPGAVTSVIMQLGNDSSNYYSKTITAGHFEAFMTGWNLCRFDLSDAAITGTVDMATIDYITFTVTYGPGNTVTYTKTLTTPVDMSVDNFKSDGSVFVYLDFSSKTSLSTLRLDNITAQIGTLYDINYYSSFVFRNNAGTWIEEPTSDSDLVNLSPLSYRIFDAELSRIITQQVQGSMGGFDYAYWDKQLNGADGTGETSGLYYDYGVKYPSEIQEGQTNYYTFSQDLDGFDEDNDNDGWGTNNNII